jgi:hypothetical protein
MKICLLATPRSGSKSILALLQSTFWYFDYYSVSEPFNYEHHEIMGTDTHDFFTRIISRNDVIIKTLINQKPKNFNTIDEWYDSLFEIFDKVIILDRINKKEQTESYLHCLTKSDFGRWHVPTVYDLTNISKELYEETFNYLTEQRELLKSLSLKYATPFYNYEHIFIDKNENVINDFFNYIEMEKNDYNLNKFVFSENLKVRLYSDKKTLM